MLRFVARYGLVRVVGRRALPALMVWDAVVMANKARQIPVVDRGLRRGAGAVRRGAVGALARRRRPRRRDVPDPADHTQSPRNEPNP
jgi:hypothetical protein